MINLGNIVGLIKSELAPTKTYVIWAKILNPAFPNVVELMIYDGVASTWVPMVNNYVKITLDYTAFAAASAQNDVSLINLPSGYKLDGLIMKHSAAFSGGSTGSAEVTVGIAGKLDKYPYEALNIFGAPSSTNFTDDNVNTIEDWDADTDVRAQVTITGDTLDNVTAGEIDFYILIKKVKA